MKSKIDEIADRLTHAFYDDIKRCDYLASIVINITALLLYRIIYGDDDVAQSFVDNYSDNYIFTEQLERMTGAEFTHTEYEPPVPFNRFKYSDVGYDLLDNLADLSNNLTTWYRIVYDKEPEHEPDRCPEYASVMILFLQEYRRAHPKDLVY